MEDFEDFEEVPLKPEEFREVWTKLRPSERSSLSPGGLWVIQPQLGTSEWSSLSQRDLIPE